MWVKLDDQLHSHPKVLEAWSACKASLGLHMMALSHAAAYLTDGEISETWVRARLPRRSERDRATRALVDAGLWEPREHGWAIHDFLEVNPLAERDKVLTKRAEMSEQRAEAGRRGASKRWQAHGKAMPQARPVPDLFPQLAG